MMDANQVWGVDEAIAAMQRLRGARPVVDRGADEPRRRARPRADPPRGRADPRRDRRARPEPRHLQAALPGRGDRRLPDRRVPHRRRERGDRRAPARGEVRHPGLPARGRRRPLRVRPAPRVLRLHRRQRLARGPGRRVGRPPARALPRSRGRRATAATSRPRRPATASRCCPPRSTSTSSRTARRGRRSRARWAANDGGGRESERARPVAASSCGSTATACSQAALLSLRAGPGADPAPADRRRQPDDAGLLHEPEHRQRLLADLGDRRRSRSASCS